MLGAALTAVVAAATGVGVAVAHQSGSHDRSLAVAAEAKASATKATYVIFLLGDGMGQSEITIARNYYYGAGGRLPGIDAPPLTGDITTYAVEEKAPATPNYVTDSAASGTGWATGMKTSNGRISTTPLTDKDLPTIFEQAAKKGWATGNVSTAEITDATPAVLASHVVARGCQGPADMAACPQDKKSAGGPGSIAEQEVDHKSDVILGGGKARFDQKIDGGLFAGKTVIDQAKALGYTVVTDAAGLDATKKGPVLGLFNAGNMSLEFKGLPADKPVTGPQVCQENQRPANEPSLAAMTQKAIDLLLAKNPKHFYLQVEGASIDKQDHAAAPCEQIGETIAFDNAVQVALAFAKTHPKTLIVVTADHSHSSQIVDVASEIQGLGSILTTKVDKAPMEISYGTAPKGGSQSHTGAQLRVAAQGPQSANVVGLNDQTELYHVLARAVGIE
jgi:alkaline phosphatase/streptomycin-6-phosphatase